MSDRLHQWNNDASTVLVESWDDGAVLIKERPDRYHTWGPPRTLRSARTGPLTPEELGTLLAAITHGMSSLEEPDALDHLETAVEKLRVLHGLPPA